MQASVDARVAMESELRQGVAQGQFVLHYQAQVDANGTVSGAEVLVRWLHPKKGLVSPADFIPLAEETGLIMPLGSWVLHTACEQLASWAGQPHMAHLTLAVNVSSYQFRRTDFVDHVVEILRKTGANPDRLKLELTESLLVSSVDDVIEKMNALKSRGVRFSLDDFGTGYSSLTYLKRLPLHQLKIDKSFVRDILVDSNASAIATIIISFAQTLGLTVIAEGVETDKQRDFLLDAGCHAFQGYLFHRPSGVQAFEALVEGRSPGS
jgi:EAL domain-containing protein (putative c-di-GMP-specific phosphodiesterase class I)